MAAPAIFKKPLLSDLVAKMGKVPSSHIRPVGDLANVGDESGAGIPLIDLKMLNATGPERRKVVEAIGRACESDGFFMVTNHGIPAPVVEGMLRVAREFFHLPESERLKCYSDDPKKAIRLSTSFKVQTEKVNSWRDFLRLYCYPLESFVDQWPSNPPSFRQVVGTYATEARALALRLLEAISESLGLERSHMVAAMEAQHMSMNYYPPCQRPELTYGLPGHKDPNAITLLLQDGVSGLQVQRGGRWVAVNPVPNALVINIGDQMQALSNDRCKSVLHRVIVNSERILVRTSLCRSPDAVIALADDDCVDLFSPGGSMDLHKLNGPERKLTRMLPRWLQKSGGSKPTLLPVVDPSAAADNTSVPILEVLPGESGSFPPTPSLSSAGENAARAAMTTDREDAFLFAINGITVALLGSIKVKDISRSWQTKCKVPYGIFIPLSLLSAVTSIYNAISPSTRRSSFFFAWLGLLVAIALFVVNIIFQLL